MVAVNLRLSPELRGRLFNRLRPAHRMPADNAGHNVSWVLFLIRDDLIPIPMQGHRAFIALEIDPAHAGLGESGGTLAKLAYGVEAGILDNRVLHVGHLAVVFEKKAASGARYRGRTLHTGNPMARIQRMGPEIGHLSAGIIPKPAEMIERAVRIVGPLGSRAKPQIIIQIRWRSAVRGIAKARCDVAEKVALH